MTHPTLSIRLASRPNSPTASKFHLTTFGLSSVSTRRLGAYLLM